MALVPGGHVVLREQRDLQDFGGAEDFFLADGGDGLSRDAVNLVEGVRTEASVVRRADEQQQADGRLAVAAQLQADETETHTSVER